MIKPMKVLDKLYNHLAVSVKMKNAGSSCGNGLRINGRIKLHGNGSFVIGNDVRINSSESSNPIGGMERTILSSYQPGRIVIGDHVGMSNVAIVCKNSVTIEEHVKIGGSVKIYDTDFHALDTDTRCSERDAEQTVSKPIVIQRKAFIGAHSIILKGVTIGEGAVIGAGSVVTKDVGANEIWAGNPARFIRKI